MSAWVKSGQERTFRGVAGMSATRQKRTSRCLLKQGWRHGEDKRFGRRCIAVNFSPKLLRRSHLLSSLYRKLRANSVTYDSKIWRCAWPR